MNRFFIETVRMVTAQLISPEGRAFEYPLVARQLVDIAVTALLNGFANPTMTADYQPEPRKVSPAAVRRAADYIDEHAAEPISVSDIAEATGVEPRELQATFARDHEITRMEYLRHVRLDGAHRDLQARTPEAAILSQLWQPSHIAGDSPIRGSLPRCTAPHTAERPASPWERIRHDGSKQNVAWLRRRGSRRGSGDARVDPVRRQRICGLVLLGRLRAERGQERHRGCACSPQPRRAFAFGLEPNGETVVCNPAGIWAAAGPLIGVYNVTRRALRSTCRRRALTGLPCSVSTWGAVICSGHTAS